MNMRSTYFLLLEGLVLTLSKALVPDQPSYGREQGLLLLMDCLLYACINKSPIASFQIDPAGFWSKYKSTQINLKSV